MFISGLRLNADNAFLLKVYHPHNLPRRQTFTISHETQKVMMSKRSEKKRSSIRMEKKKMIRMTEAKLQTLTFPPLHSHSGKRLRLTSSFVHFLCLTFELGLGLLMRSNCQGRN